MEKKKFTFRQKWFPIMEDAIEMDEFVFVGRWLRSLSLTGALMFSIYQGIGNNIEYSEGQRIGVLNKISEKGMFWKTYEGQLSLEGRTSTGDNTGAGVWDFSIDRLATNGENVPELYSQIRQAMENGQRVKITYSEPLATWPWRAGTTYLLQSVEPLDLQTNK